MKIASIREMAVATPPVSVTGLTVVGVPLSEWVLFLTAIYTIFLIVDKLPTVAQRILSALTWVKEKFNGKESSD